jgi:hypothetical protein
MFCCARSRRGATASPSPTSRAGQTLSPGTSLLLVRATNSFGQRSNEALVKLFVLSG